MLNDNLVNPPIMKSDVSRILLYIYLRHMSIELRVFPVFIWRHAVDFLKISVKGSKGVVSAIHGTFQHRQAGIM